MNKNEVCRDILNMKEVLGTKITENLANADLSLEEKRNLSNIMKASVSQIFDSVVDRVLKG